MQVCNTEDGGNPIRHCANWSRAYLVDNIRQYEDLIEGEAKWLAKYWRQCRTNFSK